MEPRNEFEEMSRLKSKRRKVRLQRWGRDKELVELDKERHKLFIEKHSTAYITLEKPIEKGWKRFYVLRQDVARSSEGIFYQSILDKINTEEVYKRKDFLQKDRKTKKWVAIEQHTKWMSACEFEKLNFSDRQKELFEFKWVRERPDTPKFRAYVYLCEWQFEFKVKKNWITKIPVHNNVLESRLAEIDNHIERNHLEYRINWLLGNRRWRRNAYKREKYRPKDLNSFFENID